MSSAASLRRVPKVPGDGGRPVPKSMDVHLILDNYGTHKTLTIRRWLVRHPRYHVHFTHQRLVPINLVERWFATLTERQLRRAVHRSTFVWTKTADAILKNVARFSKRTYDSG